MLSDARPGIVPTAEVSPRYALAMQRWLDAHPEWSERKAMDVAVSLFLIVHSAGNPAFEYAERGRGKAANWHKENKVSQPPCVKE